MIQTRKETKLLCHFSNQPRREEFSDLWRHSRPLCTLEMTVHNVLTLWVGARLESATDAVAAANRRRQGGFGSQSAAAHSWARSY